MDIRIPFLNAFKLRITGNITSGTHTETADMNVVRNLIVNFVRRGRIFQAHGIDMQGRIVILNLGTLPSGTYGVELVGYYNGEPWRFFKKDVFEIVRQNSDATPAGSGDVPTYDVTFELNFGGESVSPEYVDAAIAAHDADEQAHADIREALQTLEAELRQEIAEAGEVNDVQIDGQSILDPETKVANIDSSQFGKVDDVEVNGHSVLDPLTKKVSLTIPSSASAEITENDPTAAPEANAVIEDGEIKITLKNVKGEKGDQGDQGKQGVQGPQGQSAVFDPETGNISTLEQTFGDSTVNPMSQRAVTDAVHNLQTILLSEIELLGGCYGIVDGEMAFVESSSTRSVIIPVDDLMRVRTTASKSTASNKMPAVIYLKAEEAVEENRISEQYAEGESITSSISLFESPLIIPANATHAIINVVREHITTKNCSYTKGKSVKEEISMAIQKLNDLGYSYSGIATPSTMPSVSGKAFYFAKEEGTYEYFDSIQVRNGLTILKYDGEWTSEELFRIEDTINWGSKNVVESGAIFDGLHIVSTTKMIGGNLKLSVGYFYFNGDARLGKCSEVLNHNTLKNRNIIIPVDILSSVKTMAGKPGKSVLPAIIYLDGYDLDTANVVGSQFAESGIYTTGSNDVFNSPLDIPSSATHAIINLLNGYGENTANAEITTNKSIRSLVLEIATYLGIPVNTRNINTHGAIGENYPEQMHDIEEVLSVKDTSNKVLHFLHISDNHGHDFGYADEFLDSCPAKFLVNTGDLVADNYEANSPTIGYALATTKPVYLILGNHDYFGASEKTDVFNAYFGETSSHESTHAHNGVNTNKTYYSVDYDAGVKCIFLDINEGYTDAELQEITSTTDMNALINGKMSQTQIAWFISQLQDAINRNLHVCAFIHTIPSPTGQDAFGEYIDDFFTGNYTDGCCHNLAFLLSIVDAFMAGGNVNFSYDGIEYTHDFGAVGGHFVSWFVGHKHRDCAGWLAGHENQFAVSIITPTEYGSKDDTFDGSKLGVHFNYVTVNTQYKKLVVYRVGQQKTVWLGERKAFNVSYN